MKKCECMAVLILKHSKKEPLIFTEGWMGPRAILDILEKRLVSY
jgi:hypothetical protein